MDIRSIYLILVALGLVPVGLAYGAAPQTILPDLLGINDLVLNQIHIFRAIMGLYLAMALFWLCGAFNSDLRRPALWSMLVFMWGLAAGRILSLTIDGEASILLVGSMVLELAGGLFAAVLLRKR
ncbi:DUF4345 domain-containing protein [Flexibacterium corallicola]|uniref:DUF4345 domain-containing protein n=1 Tax=Flexibacterium corallicola TaxID=3037259 RepID=UPI00286F4981|nr:DUF4345 domain-containing protein [Pseudovibrio sp. M1P-2-3]